MISETYALRTSNILKISALGFTNIHFLEASKAKGAFQELWAEAQGVGIHFSAQLIAHSRCSIDAC